MRHAYGNAHIHSDGDGDGHIHSDGNCDSNSYAYTDSNSDSDIYCNGYGDALQQQQLRPYRRGLHRRHGLGRHRRLGLRPLVVQLVRELASEPREFPLWPQSICFTRATVHRKVPRFPGSDWKSLCFRRRRQCNA